MTEIPDQTIADAAAVLGKASLLDPRMPKPDKAGTLAWAEILAERGAGLTLDDLLPAITMHYSTSTERLMPATLIKLARERRRENFERSALDSPERRRLELVSDSKAAPDDEPAGAVLDRREAVQRALDYIGGKFGNLDRPAFGKGKLVEPAPAPVPCPDCGALGSCEHDEQRFTELDLHHLAQLMTASEAPK
jgi:hypothetical protein